jgi:hypothetical protein
LLAVRAGCGAVHNARDVQVRAVARTSLRDEVCHCGGLVDAPGHLVHHVPSLRPAVVGALSSCTHA